MIVSGSIYFLGKYRPLHVEDTAMVRVKLRLKAAAHGCEPELRDWLHSKLDLAFSKIGDKSCTSVAIDHCDRGVSFAARPHDRFLDEIIADMPPCPGLDYDA